MIDYDAGKYQIAIILQTHGSVFPKACMFSLPAAIIAGIFHQFLMPEDFRLLKDNAAYSSFSFVLGFLLVFRTSQAYTRFWEGTTLMQLLRGQWVGAFGSILAFSSISKRPLLDTEDFRHKLVRLFSLLHASGLRYVSAVKIDPLAGEGGMSIHDGLEIIDLGGLDDHTIAVIRASDDETKIYVVIQWIQQLIISNIDSGILPVPPPIISRVFQDISTGIVTLNNARKISDTPFPFPYAQMMTFMLLLHLLTTPFVVCMWTSHWTMACLFTFMPVSAFWSINFIAAEIEQPFGGDVNDIDVPDLQAVMNKCLISMLEPDIAFMPSLKAMAERDHRLLLSHENVSIDPRPHSKTPMVRSSFGAHAAHASNPGHASNFAAHAAHAKVQAGEPPPRAEREPEITMPRPTEATPVALGHVPPVPRRVSDNGDSREGEAGAGRLPAGGGGARGGVPVAELRAADQSFQGGRPPVQRGVEPQSGGLQGLPPEGRTPTTELRTIDQIFLQDRDAEANAGRPPERLQGQPLSRREGDGIRIGNAYMAGVT